MKKEKDCGLLIVQDSGIGIPPKDLPHIFEPFYRGSNVISGERLKGGAAGLGLAIVRQICRLHRARIEVKSDPGTGTTFSIWFKAV